MTEKGYPRWYSQTKEEHREYIGALEKLGETVRKQGPFGREDVSIDSVGGCSGDSLRGIGPQPCQEGDKGRSNTRRLTTR